MRAAPAKDSAFSRSLRKAAASSWLVLEAKKQPLRECERCHAIWSDGHWHRLRSAAFLRELRRQVAVLGALCEACRIERQAHGPVGAVGELRIAPVPTLIVREVVRTIRGVGNTAMNRDPEDRVIAIEDRGRRGLRVTTTENQLAVRIGKKLDSAFKGGELKIKYSDQDMPVLVRWTPPAAKS